jgi:hypothetical protein
MLSFSFSILLCIIYLLNIDKINCNDLQANSLLSANKFKMSYQKNERIVILKTNSIISNVAKSILCNCIAPRIFQMNFNDQFQRPLYSDFIISMCCILSIQMKVFTMMIVIGNILVILLVDLLISVIHLCLMS